MKKLNDPLSNKRVIKKNISKYRITIALLFVTLLVSIITYNICDISHRKKVFKKLDVKFTEVKAIEYGTANYDPMKLVENVPYGKIVNYTETVDTSSTGKQKLMFVVEDEKVSKVINVEVEIVDTEKPDIEIKEDKIKIEEGNDYNAMDNIKSVVDKVDGNLEYQQEETEEKTSYYTVTTDLNTKVAGDYDVKIKAVDKNGNTSEKTYTVNVVEKPKPVKLTMNNYNINNNAVATVDTSSVVGAAYSFVGYNYTYGGASPSTGFDCSGFVQYIYSLFGKNVGRTTSAQANVGAGISKDNMQPGDIIVWSDNGYSPTHSTLYVGNGLMVHAANSNDGVITSSVDSWERYAGKIVAIRRV